MSGLHAVLRIAIGIAFACIGWGAQAQEQYPTHAMTIVVPFTAGGPTDILARIIGQYIGTLVGQSVIVENTTGAGGTLAAQRVARAAPDGYTMVMGNLGTHAASLGIYEHLSYDPRRDFEPVIRIASTPMVLVTRPGLPAHRLDEVIAYAKANKGKMTMGSAGVGSISHLSLLLFNHLTGADVKHVPYRGLPQATNDLQGGQIDSMFDQVVTAAPHIASGGETGIVVTIPTRAASIPNVPSASEAGLPALQTVAWTALFMPKGTPKPIVERVNAAVQKAMDDPAISKRLAEIGADIPPPDQRTPEALAHLVSAEVDKWVPLIKSAGIVGE